MAASPVSIPRTRADAAAVTCIMPGMAAQMVFMLENSSLPAIALIGAFAGLALQTFWVAPTGRATLAKAFGGAGR